MSELSEFGANRSMMSLSVHTGAQGSLGQSNLGMNPMASFGKQQLKKSGSKVRQSYDLIGSLKQIKQ
jgi:hypothetical protein